MEVPDYHENSFGCRLEQNGQRNEDRLDSLNSCICGEHSKKDPIATGNYCHYDLGSNDEWQTSGIDNESGYHQLLLEKEEMERSYERERQQRQIAEQNLQQELDEKMQIKERFSSLQQSLQSYNADLNMFKNENKFLRDQFDSLKNVINSRMSLDSTSNTTNHFGQTAVPSCTITRMTESLDPDSYKQEIAALAIENDLFGQIIEIIQSQEKASWDQRHSEEYTLDNKWQSDTEVVRLQEENYKFKSKIRELERSRGELESELEQVTLNLEDKNKQSKKDISRLEEEIRSKSLNNEDLERQLYHLRMEYHEETQKWGLKLDTEILMKTQVQEEVNVLQGTIQNLEAERIEMVAKLEELYNSENDIIQARNDLEVRFSEEIGELQSRLEEEMRTKIELSQEMTVLMNEFVDLRKKSKQTEQMYISEIEALKLNAGFEMGGSAIATHTTKQHHTNSVSGGQAIPSQINTRNIRNDVQCQLNQEIKQREVLEKENKELLYEMKNLLSSAGQLSRENSKQHIASSFSIDTADANQFTKKIRTLENKVGELIEECETLQRCANRGKEVEKKNRVLINELNELSIEKEDILRKQRKLVYEVDHSSSSLHDVVEKNRRLMDEIESKSRSIRDMEDTFRQERHTLMRRYDREKNLEIREIEQTKEDLNKRLDYQVKKNRKLMNMVQDLEDEIRCLKQSDGQALNGSIRDWSSPSGGRSTMIHNSRELVQETRELEHMLQENERIEAEHLKTLEEQRKQMREEFEMEKQKLRQCFEDEKRDLVSRLSAGISPHVALGRNSASGVVHGTFYNPTGQIPDSVSQNTNIMYPTTQGSANVSQDMNSNQYHCHSELNQQNGNSPQIFPSQMPISYSQAPQHQNKLHVSFQTPQPRLQQHLPHPQQQRGQSIVYTKEIAENCQDLQANDNLNRLQLEVRRLNTEKKNMEKRIKDMESRMGNASGNEGATTGSTFSVSVCGDDGIQKDRITSCLVNSVKNKQGRSHQGSSLAIKYNNNGNIDEKLRVTMKKLVEEHRQNSDELRKQIKLQNDSFEKEKLMIQKDYNTLLSNNKRLRKEIHILKHEREDMQRNLSKQRREIQIREERSRNEVMSIRKDHEDKMRQEIEKSERTTRELQRRLNISERALKEFEVKFRDEVTRIEKKHSLDRMNIEAMMRQSENQVKSRLESHYQAKMNSEKEKYENALKELRKEIKCLQSQRKEIQLRLSSDVSESKITKQKDTTYNISLQNNDVNKHFEGIEARFAQDKRRLEDTISNLRNDIEDLKNEKSDMKTCYKEELQQREDKFERVKSRMEERHRHDMNELKTTIEMLQNDNIKNMSMAGRSVHQHQKFVNLPHTAIIQKKNRSLELRNSELESDIVYLKGRVNGLESRQTKLLVSRNQDKSSRGGERKVRFNPVDSSEGQRRRSFSSTYVNNMAGAGDIGDRSSRLIRPCISRDDLAISSSRHGSHGMAFSSGSSAAGYLTGSHGFLGKDYANSAHIVHIPSTGILNGVNSLSVGNSRGRRVEYLGSNNVGTYSLDLVSGSRGGLGSTLGSGKDGRSVTDGSFLSCNGVGESSYQVAGNLSSSSTLGHGSGRVFGSSGGVSSGNTLGTHGSFSGEAIGLSGAFLSGKTGRTSHGNSSFLTGNRIGSGSAFLSSNSHGDGLNSRYLATSASESGFGHSNSSIGMQSRLSTGQRLVEASSSSGGRNLEYGALFRDAL